MSTIKLSLMILSLLMVVGCQDATVGSKLFGEKNIDSVSPLPDLPYVKPVDPEQAERFQKFQLMVGTQNFGKCSQCHRAGGADSGAQDYSNFKKEQDWVEAFLVTPGEPENSLLFVSLFGAGVDANSESMPDAGGPLSIEEINNVRDWITNIDPETFTPKPGPQRCGTADAGGAPERTQRVITIFMNNCTGCHNAGAAIKNLDLATDQQFYDVGAVTPGNLNGSVYARLRGQNEAGDPVDRDMGNLSAAEIADIRAWVCQMPEL